MENISFNSESDSKHTDQNRFCYKVFYKVDFLHDIGSDFTIITRETYDRLRSKPPLQKADKNGIGVNGSSFNLDGIVYLNIELIDTGGNVYNIDYEPVYVSECVSIIYGIKTEKRFTSCTRNFEEQTITYK